MKSITCVHFRPNPSLTTQSISHLSRKIYCTQVPLYPQLILSTQVPRSIALQQWILLMLLFYSSVISDPFVSALIPSTSSTFYMYAIFRKHTLYLHLHLSSGDPQPTSYLCYCILTHCQARVAAAVWCYAEGHAFGSILTSTLPMQKGKGRKRPRALF